MLINGSAVPMTVALKIIRVFWDVIPCNLLDRYPNSEESVACISGIEDPSWYIPGDSGNMLLRNSKLHGVTSYKAVNVWKYFLLFRHKTRLPSFYKLCPAVSIIRNSVVKRTPYSITSQMAGQGWSHKLKHRGYDNALRDQGKRTPQWTVMDEYNAVTCWCLAQGKTEKKTSR